jgi:WD40 repeat protein
MTVCIRILALFLAVSIGTNSTVRSEETLRTIRCQTEPSVWSVALSQDGKTVVAVQASGAVSVWQINSEKEWARIRAFTISQRCYTVSSDLAWAIAADDAAVGVWDVMTGSTVGRFPCKNVSRVAVSSSREVLAIVSGGCVHLWEPCSGNCSTI